MIKFVDGKVDKPNATVRFGKTEHKACSSRDAEGNIEVTIDMELEPDHGEEVVVVLHSENDSEFCGLLHKEKDELVFKATNETIGY